MRDLIDNTHKPIASNGSLNRLLAVAQLGALFLYIRKQALAGFPYTWAIILAAVTHRSGHKTVNPRYRVPGLRSFKERIV